MGRGARRRGRGPGGADGVRLRRDAHLPRGPRPGVRRGPGDDRVRRPARRGGVVASLLGLVAVVGGVRGDRDLSAADLFALEVDGVGPGALRRVLLARAALVLAVGLPVGLLAGAGLAAAATRLLGTGPDGRPLDPPLAVVLAAPPTALVVVGALVGTVLAAALTAAASPVNPASPPPSWTCDEHHPRPRPHSSSRSPTSSSPTAAARSR